MREIMFRGLQAHPLPGKQYFVYGWITEPNGPGEGIAMMDVGQGERWQVLMDTVGQYTGMKDIDGMEIYEGDLLEPLIGQLKGRVGVIEYAGDRFVMKIPFECSTFHYAIGGASNYFRIVGNIHENPELFPKVLEGVEYIGNRFQGHTIVQGNIHENPDRVKF